MRKKIALKNSIIGLLSNIITMLLSFMCTRVFMTNLGVEIKGINGLITNCLGLLQLTELGIGNAIIYALYKPIVDNNIREIQILMQLYSKLYKYIGTTIIVIGLVMSLFIGWFITDSVFPMYYIRIAFYIQLFSTASTYFISYKRNLIYADQKMYINTLVDMICEIICNIVKINIILKYKSYIAYLLIQIIQTWTSNIVINIWCDRHYPFLKEKVNEKYDKMPQLKENIRNIMFGKVGGFVYSSTDNLIISKFVGIVAVGYMSGYYQITTAINKLISAVTSPIQPIMGNYVNECQDIDKMYNVFLDYTFIRFCIANIVTVGMITMMNPLISIWLGEEYVLSIIISVLMAIDIFISIIHGPLVELIQVLGLFEKDRNLSFGGMLINLTLSILFAFKFGTCGVLMGTVVSQFYYWSVRGCIVFKTYLKKGVRKYIVKVAGYIILTMIDICILVFIRDRLCKMFTVFSFLVMCIICIFISLASIIICYGRAKEFSSLIQFVKVLLKRENN